MNICQVNECECVKKESKDMGLKWDNICGEKRYKRYNSKIKRTLWLNSGIEERKDESQILGSSISMKGGALQWDKKWEFNLVPGCETLR